MHSKSNNIEIMINDKAHEVIKECFQLIQLLHSRYQIGLEPSPKGKSFSSIVFNYYIIDIVK